MAAQAMILAAGLGTRLLPVTRQVPKPLFPVANLPLIQRSLELLEGEGFSSIHVNLYHLSGRLGRFLASLQERWRREGRSSRIHAVVEEELLDTGGGIGNASCHFVRGEPILVVNGDIFIGFSPQRLLKTHLELEAAATLLLHRRPGLGRVVVSGENDVAGFADDASWAFTGVYVLGPEVIALLPGDRPCSIVPVLQKAISSGLSVKAAFPCDVASETSFFWEDIGTPAGYLSAHALFMKAHGFKLLDPCGLVPPDVEVRDWAVVGENAKIGAKAVLERCVVWNGAEVPEGARVSDAAVTPYGWLRSP